MREIPANAKLRQKGPFMTPRVKSQGCVTKEVGCGGGSKGHEEHEACVCVCVCV